MANLEIDETIPQAADFRHLNTCTYLLRSPGHVQPGNGIRSLSRQDSLLARKPRCIGISNIMAGNIKSALLRLQTPFGQLNSEKG